MFSFVSFIKDMLFFAAYVNIGASFPEPLSKEEEAHFIDLCCNHNDENARVKLIEHNLRLVAHIAKKYIKSGVELDELISIGSMGLVKAVSTFEPSKGNLATYASRCIENQILMFMRRERKRNMYETSFDTPVGHDSDGNEVTIGDKLGSDPDEVQKDAYRSILREKLIAASNEVLTDREKTVISLRYNLDGEKPLAQREVAKKLNVSRSYVSRIEKRALTKLSKCFNNDL